MHKIERSVKTLIAKGFFAMSVLSFPLMYACSPGATSQGGSGNTGTYGTGTDTGTGSGTGTSGSGTGTSGSGTGSGSGQ